MTIKDSYLWNDVVVEDNCTIDKSLFCDNVTVHNNVTVCPYCLLSWNVSCFIEYTCKWKLILLKFKIPEIFPQRVANQGSQQGQNRGLGLED